MRSKSDQGREENTPGKPSPLKDRNIRSVVHAVDAADASRVGPTGYDFKRSIRKYALDGEPEGPGNASTLTDISVGEVVKQPVPDQLLNEMSEEMAQQQKQHHYEQTTKHLAGDTAKWGIEPSDPRHGYERRITDQDVRTTMRHQMDRQHRNTTFL